ncbi:MarR family winged helix-turn-helix transcriptional regulator [Deinococcus sp. Leaf326]|jgi:DNA-binding MarR family transcriptional regulator|uniref:MarR family winged helix-turn-helix transcriptional regulator n=1 Tax=Deinococcus sp. Leaf326 TaxID=1736338 RepID=UPI0009E8611C|nr:MarR family transcriptional regulator [Deinococcus sp. Leaf326]
MKREQPPDPLTPLPPDSGLPGGPDEENRDLAKDLGRALKRYQSYVSACTQRMAQEDSSDMSLSARQIGVLFQLRARGTQNVSALARSVNLTLSATSHLLERLVQHGLIVRGEDPDNRRQKRIALTAQGLELLSRLEQDAVHAYTLLLLHAPAEVLRDLQGCLHRLDHYLPSTPGEFAAQVHGAPCADPPCISALSPSSEDHP